jgi:N-acyl-D-aspartate/D-glutamate deacylase
MEGGSLVDGTGLAARLADVVVTDGRISAIVAPGAADIGAGTHRIDASGLVVAPGFVDVHTHLDAQVFWDSALSPVPLFGVTTVISGNCGFSVAPLMDHAVDYLVRMLARVEGMPLEALLNGVPWNWRSFDDYLREVRSLAPAIHMGFLVGHSALRRVVMGEQSHEESNPAQIEAMCALLEAALTAGALGLSTSWARTHVDGVGDPVPSRMGSREEMLALAEVVGRFPGTQLQVAPGFVFDDDAGELMRTMSVRANRPVNWNVYVPNAATEETCRRMLATSGRAKTAGGSVWALAYPDVIRIRFTLDRASATLDVLEGWSRFLGLPPAEKAAALRRPDVRQALSAAAGPVYGEAFWGGTTVMSGVSSEVVALEGRRLEGIASERGCTAFDALCDVALADDLRTAFTPPSFGEDEETWKLRAESWADPRVVLGASDAGAHLDSITTYDWAPVMLAANRRRSIFSLEEAVRRLTSVQADAYGLVGRGRLVEGAVADVVIFDPERVSPGRAEWRDDLPAGSGRLYQEPVGVHHVVAGGVHIVRDGCMTGDAGGTVLQAGRDTSTVSI